MTYQKKRVSKVCGFCAKEFEGIPRQKYCSQECLKKVIRLAYPLRTAIEKTCPICQKQFVTTRASKKYCSVKCRDAWFKPIIRQYQKRARESRKLVEQLPKDPRGFYVYGWYRPEEDLPFYIGKGTGNRAWENHKSSRSSAGGALETHYCEDHRTSKTIIVIYRDSLTEEGAFLVEAVLASVFRGLGAVLTNQAELRRRSEVPPLELA